MQIFSVQFRDGVALVNHDDCYDTTGHYELPDGETITIEPLEPPARLSCRRSRLCKATSADERCKPMVNRNGGRKTTKQK